VKEFLSFNSSDCDMEFQDRVLSIVATLLARLKRLLYKHSRDLQKGKAGDHATVIENIEGFLIWLQTLAVGGIYNNASFSRIVYSIGLLKEYSLMEDSNVASMQISKKLMLESNPLVVDALLLALNIHGGRGAFELLTRKGSLLGYEEVERVRGLIDSAFEKVCVCYID
jgi:hypothetical protein